MANNKANANKEEVKKEVVVESEIKVETQQPVRQKAVQIDRNEMIPVRSVCYGKLTYISSKTGLMTVWTDFGVVEYIEYGELLTMRAAQPKFLTKPWVIIEDEQVVSTIGGLKDLYEKIADVGEDLVAFFEREPSEIDEIFAKLPNGTKGLLATKAREMVDNGTLYDIRKISVIDKHMKTGLKELIK